MYRQIVVLTGAGISAESGLRTFRDQDGLWEEHKIEDVATPEGYQRDPEMVERFYNERWQQLHDGNVEPNAAHLALARLENEFDGQLLVVTQNIDDLHERAGSRRLLHMHGELTKGRCPRSQQTFLLTDHFSVHHTCTCCIPAQRLRPHVVWFGEMPIGLDRIQHALDTCDLFIAIGTSGTVYPAAGFVDTANHHGAQTVEVNLIEADRHSQFQYHLQGKASEIVPQLVEQILQGQIISDQVNLAAQG
ncbi:Sir2 family NAD+-dependent deacetylase [Shewanella colwelliana]|uniref:NAD-dependent protein deacylase n=1 Tax=Shewanella colwelliana TaxID=23 RepID=A0A1E5IZS1_SHECO|nr:Sir2 family NAD+-dependent deacetylase [Shewanella colwelliana]MDX1282043.1 Sir2 family NAD+-dependent deacetylase [Shewanella colwelliana]OEG75914.1 NAD-dependent protein deacylase [Shewanella colwelliana]GIU41551.1 NAD-dependent protein deacylase [Shewanella colwelliana]